jgi:hypothetical protein
VRNQWPYSIDAARCMLRQCHTGRLSRRPSYSGHLPLTSHLRLLGIEHRSSCRRLGTKPGVRSAARIHPQHQEALDKWLHYGYGPQSYATLRIALVGSRAELPTPREGSQTPGWMNRGRQRPAHWYHAKKSVGLRIQLEVSENPVAVLREHPHELCQLLGEPPDLLRVVRVAESGSPGRASPLAQARDSTAGLSTSLLICRRQTQCFVGRMARLIAPQHKGVALRRFVAPPIADPVVIARPVSTYHSGPSAAVSVQWLHVDRTGQVGQPLVLEPVRVEAVAGC